MNTSGKKLFLADLGLFYAAAVWGATFFMVKAALADVDPVVLVAYRFILAGVILLIFLLYKRQPIFEGIGRAAFLGLLLWFLYIPQTLGLKYTTASNSGFITGLFVAFIPFFLLTIFKKKPSLMEIIACAVSLLGLWVLTGGMADMNTGDILTLAAAMTYALHVLYSDRYMKEGMNPYLLACQQFLIVGLLSLLTAFVVDLPFTVKSSYTAGVIVFLALFPSLSAFVIQLLAQKIRSPLRVSLIFALEPVFAAIFAWTLGDEIFVTRRALGGLLIFAALIISGLPTISILKSRLSRPNDALYSNK